MTTATHHVARVCVMAASLLAGACSTIPAQQEIKAFSDGVTELSTYQTAVVAGRRTDQQRRDRVVQNFDHAGFTPTCARGDPGCGLVQRTEGPRTATSAAIPRVVPVSAQSLQAQAPRGPDGKPSDIPVVPTFCVANPETSTLAIITPEQARDAAAGIPADTATPPPLTEAAIFSALDEYAGALRAISNAEDRTALDAANAKLVTAVTTLVTTVGTAVGGAGAAAGPVAGAVTGLVLKIRNAYLERQRFVALRTAVREACVPVRTLALAAGLILEAHRTTRLGLNGEVMNRASRLTLGMNAGRFATPAQAAWAFEEGQAASNSSAGLAAHPWEAAKKLVQAHNELVAVVLGERGQDLQFLIAVGEFSRSVKALRDALAAANAASK